MHPIFHGVIRLSVCGEMTKENDETKSRKATTDDTKRAVLLDLVLRRGLHKYLYFRKSATLGPLNGVSLPARDMVHTVEYLPELSHLLL